MHTLASILSKNNYSNSTSRSNTSWPACRVRACPPTPPGRATRCCCCFAGFPRTAAPSHCPPTARTPRRQCGLVPPTMGLCVERRQRRLGRHRPPTRRTKEPATASWHPKGRRRRPSPLARPAVAASTRRRAAPARIRQPWAMPVASSLPLPVVGPETGEWWETGGPRRWRAPPASSSRQQAVMSGLSRRRARRGLDIRTPAAAPAVAPALAVAAGRLRLLRPTAYCWTSLAPAANPGQGGPGSERGRSDAIAGTGPPLLTLTARSPWQRARRQGAQKLRPRALAREQLPHAATRCC